MHVAIFLREIHLKFKYRSLQVIFNIYRFKSIPYNRIFLDFVDAICKIHP